MSEYGCRVSKMTPKLKVEAGKYYQDGYSTILGPAVPLSFRSCIRVCYPWLLRGKNHEYTYTNQGIFDVTDSLWSKDNLVKEVPAP